MFGCDAAYLDGRLCLVAADRDAPWDGLLVGTSQAHHASLTGDIPNLQPHAVLGKWLYIPQQDESFEAAAQQLVSLTLARDPHRRGAVAPAVATDASRLIPTASIARRLIAPCQTAGKFHIRSAPKRPAGRC